MALSDADGIVLEANPAYFELYGYSPDEVIGQHFAIIFPEQRRASACELYQLAFGGEQPVRAYQSTIQRKDGTMRIVQTRISFLTQEGQRTAMLSVIRDVTEQTQAEQALRIRYKLTAALMQAVSAADVTRVTVEQLTTLLGATTGHTSVYHEIDDTFELLYMSSSAAPEQLRPWQRHAADPALPITQVVKQEQSLWFRSAQALEATYPAMAPYSGAYSPPATDGCGKSLWRSDLNFCRDANL
jgi:PAS domain S-box-containing protein